MPAYKTAGRRLSRIDALSKVTGNAIYSGDVFLPRMLHGKILRSPHAHANIKRLDTTKAKALAGVKAVITADDVPGYKTRKYLSLVEMPHLPIKKVTYASQPVAVVAADRLDIAEKALDLIDVEYEELPAILDPLEAMKSDTPAIYMDLYTNAMGPAAGEKEAKPSNIAYQMTISKGNLESGFKAADHILENTYRTAPIHHGYIEPFAAVASADITGKITVWTQNQGLFGARQMISEFLDVPVTKVKLVPVEIGGAFGGKSFLALAPLCALLALKTGRPVRMEMSREEVLTDARVAPGSVSTVKIGVTREGVITAASVRFVFDAGGFPEMSHCMFVMGNSLCQYKIPNVKIEAYDVLTNKLPVTYYRAPSTPQTHFATESHMDLVARSLNMDPIQFRLQNIAQKGDTAPNGEPIPRVGYRETLEKMAVYLKEKGPVQGEKRGRGISCGFWHGASGPYAAYVTVNTDASVTLHTGVTDVSGSRTSAAQIVAEEFDIPLEKVNVVVTDTDSTPWASPSVGSMTLYSLSKAAYRACEDAKEQLKKLAAVRLEVKPSELEFVNGKVAAKNDPSKAIKLDSLVRASLGPRSDGPVVGIGRNSILPPAPVVSVHAVDLEVDPDTGKVKILSYAAAQDAGLAINPLAVEGQIQGAVVQGIGWALMEGYVFDHGKVQNTTLLDYRMPTATDVPMIDVMILEIGSERGVYGLKQVGEPPLVPVISAIANGIHSATGKRLTHLPMAPEVVWSALNRLENR